MRAIFDAVDVSLARGLQRFISGRQGLPMAGNPVRVAVTTEDVTPPDLGATVDVPFRMLVATRPTQVLLGQGLYDVVSVAHHVARLRRLAGTDTTVLPSGTAIRTNPGCPACASRKATQIAGPALRCNTCATVWPGIGWVLRVNTIRRLADGRIGVAGEGVTRAELIAAATAAGLSVAVRTKLRDAFDAARELAENELADEVDDE